MKIITAFDSFKGCMSATDACHSAAEGILSIDPSAEVVCLPLSDGGEGMVSCITEALHLSQVSVKVHGPLMEEIEATYALSDDGMTAYMEMAAASGLPLVPQDKRNPMLTTTFGVGEMLIDAVSRGCRRVVMGIGGSATCDGGEGMIKGLQEWNGQQNNKATKQQNNKQASSLLPIEVIVASDVDNPLYGERGAAYIFAPQKGATPEQVVLLDQRLRDFARKTEREGWASPELAQHPGAGAAGGLGYALMAYLKARLCSGIDLILDTICFDQQVTDADIVITGEGKSDRQTLMGKVPMGVLRRTLGSTDKKQPTSDKKVFLLSGAIEDKDSLLDAGFASVLSINEGDARPLSMLMQREVVMQNLTSTIKKLLNNI